MYLNPNSSYICISAIEHFFPQDKIFTLPSEGLSQSINTHHDLKNLLATLSHLHPSESYHRSHISTLTPVYITRTTKICIFNQIRNLIQCLV